ncbi:FCS-Like Zinc finger 6-like [Primulina huaijiensis]|uniref:FCS-Like Zinc finger 6-like n=1 Tax=Primulina huaijiensis TaxID=1492673 RepID=UPI003CC747CE
MLGELGRRPSFRRTTSMSMIGVDHSVNVEQAALFTQSECRSPVIEYERRSLAVFSPRFDVKSSGDTQIQTDHFLKRCGLCHRSLAPDIDVYMYRGDVGFCSVECREQGMKQDERKERHAAKNISDKAETAVAA